MNIANRLEVLEKQRAPENPFAKTVLIESLDEPGVYIQLKPGPVDYRDSFDPQPERILRTWTMEDIDALPRFTFGGIVTWDRSGVQKTWEDEDGSE